MDSFSRAYAQELGYQIIMWDVDPQDWSLPGVDAIVENVLNNTSAGDIILMHDGGGDRSQTIEALDTILPTFTEQGYVFKPYCTELID